MTSRILIEELINNVGTSKLLDDVRIYVHENVSNGFWGVVFIGSEEKLKRIQEFNRAFESLKGGSEHSAMTMNIQGGEGYLEIR